MPELLQNIPLALPAGIANNGTTFQTQGRWFNGNLVRFANNTIRPIGGWHRALLDDGNHVPLLHGVPRNVIAWRGAGGAALVGVGTTERLYNYTSGLLTDITPVGFTTGEVTSVSSIGAYDAGGYGIGLYGTGSLTGALAEAAVWQLDTFGNSLVGVSTSDNKLYIWDGFSANAAVATNSPDFVSGVVVTPERFLVALGTIANDANDGFIANVRGVAWASQESTTDWHLAIDGTNTAADFQLTTLGRLMCGKRTRSETLLWTDCDLHVMTYIGGEFLYRFTQAGDKCGAVSSRSPVVIDTQAFWMGQHNFYKYDGFVQPLPCEVRDHVFNNFDRQNATKVFGMSLAEYGEVWWFYPTLTSVDHEPDAYVVYNYRENHWSIGQLRRTAGCDSGAIASPLMLAFDGEMMEHEASTQYRPAVRNEAGGTDLLSEAGIEISIEGDGSELLTERVNPFLESGPVQVDEGNRVMSVQRVIPDEATLGDVSVSLFSSLWPTDEEDTHGPYTVAQPTDVRVNARQMRIRLDELRPHDWRVGIIRLGVRPSSQR